MRLFVAIPLPEAVKNLIARSYRSFPRVKWVRPEQLHLTLRFIGEVPQKQLPSLASALAQVTVPAFNLQTDECGFFPNERRPQVFWLGLVPAPELLQMQAEIEKTLVSTGLPGETRPFMPHLTLLRFKDRPRQELLTKLSQTFTELPQQRFLCSGFNLYSSLLTPTGAIHNVESVFPGPKI